MQTTNPSCLLPRSPLRVRTFDRLPAIVGANIGLYSAYFAMQGCTVHAFEPLELNADHFEMTIRSNDLHERVHLHRLAAAQTPRNVSLRWSFKETGLTHVISPGETWGNSSNRYVAGARRSVGMYWHEQKDVPARRIDQVLSSLSNVTNVAWMKVDVEVRSHVIHARPSSNPWLESRRLRLNQSSQHTQCAGALLIVSVLDLV